MKRIYFIAAAGLVLYGTNVVAETKKPTSNWTCAEFLAVDDQFQPKVIYWSSAQSKKGKPHGAMVDIEGTEKVIPMVIDDCKKAPQASYWDKLKNAWKKVEDDAKSLGNKL